MKNNDFIPAFPQPDVNSLMIMEARGMTLRDYFAAKIIQGLVASLISDRGIVPPSKELVELSYSIADGMMEKR